MVAHLDAVTSLAVDPNGLYLMSGSKYPSARQLAHPIILSDFIKSLRVLPVFIIFTLRALE